MIDLKKGAFAPGYLQGWWGNSSSGTERERLRDLTLCLRWNNTTAIYMKIVSLKVPRDKDFIFLFIILYSRAFLASRQKTDALLCMLYKFERRHKQGIAESLYVTSQRA